MTFQEINIKIAELSGEWKRFDGDSPVWIKTVKDSFVTAESHIELPQYCTDYNAIIGEVNKLSHEEYTAFECQLIILHDDTEPNNHIPSAYCHCKAWLRVKGVEV